MLSVVAPAHRLFAPACARGLVCHAEVRAREREALAWLARDVHGGAAYVAQLPGPLALLTPVRGVVGTIGATLVPTGPAVPGGCDADHVDAILTWPAACLERAPHRRGSDALMLVRNPA